MAPVLCRPPGFSARLVCRGALGGNGERPQPPSPALGARPAPPPNPRGSVQRQGLDRDPQDLGGSGCEGHRFSPLPGSGLSLAAPRGRAVSAEVRAGFLADAQHLPVTHWALLAPEMEIPAVFPFPGQGGVGATLGEPPNPGWGSGRTERGCHPHPPPTVPQPSPHAVGCSAPLSQH